MSSKDPHTNCEEFLNIKKDFQLGHLETESPCPLTIGLSQMTKSNMNEAIESFGKVDSMMLNQLYRASDKIEELFQSIEKTFDKGNRVFLCGCGATGRLSLTIETIWKKRFKDTSKSHWVQSFMAGGDIALIASIERFEDYPEYGARQLIESGFEDGDLLIASTEGGETPWVIGCAEMAIEKSSSPPWFLYCNPDENLRKIVRSNKVLKNTKINKLNLSHGPQALAGSTRLQASTIIEAAISYALFKNTTWTISERVNFFRNHFEKSDKDLLRPFIQCEAQIYERGNFLYYSPTSELGITVLTDTTERSPTFSLHPFESYPKPSHTSWCYLLFENSDKAEDAWFDLLERGPRALEWESFKGEADEKRLYGFDFSKQILSKRGKIIQGPPYNFLIKKTDHHLIWQLDNIQASWDISSLEDFEVHLFLKMLLNTHSTLLMGLLGRYQSNIMTWVRPSNLKLIDRTVRYAQYLLKENSIEAGYEELVSICFDLRRTASGNESLVLKIVDEKTKNP